MTKNLCYTTANSERTDWRTIQFAEYTFWPNTIIQIGVFDLQNSISNLPGFILSKYPKEKHFYKFPAGAYSYLGPSTRLDIRLDEHNQPRPGDKPVSPTDELALHHDIAYRDAEKLDPESALQMKH